MLDVNNSDLLQRYLADHWFGDEPREILITPLSGGVSNSVLKVVCPKGAFVLKQALRKLKVKAEWISDLERVHVEKQVLRFLPRIIPGYTPELVFEDNDNFLFMMQSAPDHARNWKQELMSGNIDTAIAAQCGTFLGLVHARTRGNTEAADLFAEKKYFRQLRIDPFFDYLRHTHPRLDIVLDKHIRKTWEKHDSLVFGDYSPKNILVFDGRVMPIDFEVAHMGDPSFDIGFITCHLMLKSIHFPDRMHAFHKLVRVLLDHYFSNRADTDRPSLEAEAVHQLAFLMLARVDGKSPVEYIVDDEEKARVRRIAYRILQEEIQTYADVMQLVSKEHQQRL